MGWKSYACLSAIILFFSLLDPFGGEEHLAWQALDLTMTIPATIALVLFAFDKEWLPRAPWRQFSWLFAAYQIGAIALWLWGVATKPAGEPGLIPADLMFGFDLITILPLSYLDWLGVKRYADALDRVAGSSVL